MHIAKVQVYRNKIFDILCVHQILREFYFLCSTFDPFVHQTTNKVEVHS